MNETLDGIKAIAAPLITMVLGMIVLMMDLGSGPEAVRRRRSLPTISIVGLVMTGIVALVSNVGRQLMVQPGQEAAAFFGRGMVADVFGSVFCVVLCIVAGLAIAMSDRYLEERGINHGEFYALVLFSTAGAMLMAQANDLVNVFVGLEVLSVALYILCGFARRDRRSEESAVKYFLLGSFASGFLLFGTALIYGAVGLSARTLGINLGFPGSFTNFEVIGQVLRESAQQGQPLASSSLFVTGVALLMVGLGFKASVVPFHTYAPDVYEGAPTPVTAFMSAGAKIGAFAAFVRLFHTLLNAESAEPFRIVLWGLAAATMIVGNVLAVRQTNIKRMLAYSSIAHAGYILVGVLASGVREAYQYAHQAVLFYLFVYTFMNLGAFALVIWLGRNGEEYTRISDYSGLARKQPLAALAMSIFMLSLAGIPPAAGFLGKLYLFMSAVQAGEALLAGIGLVVSAIGVFYYLNLIVRMYFYEPSDAVDFGVVRGGGARWAALLAAAVTLIFGLLPNPLIGPRPADEDVVDTVRDLRLRDRTRTPRPEGTPPTPAPTTEGAPGS
ncbi:MAG: NADH-quinone oxidoreductase subunit N [Capsulimonadales bacterium]|nr:NADH-quinone oxidoreductase subunit N [Capsulimonadales bacterium]